MAYTQYSQAWLEDNSSIRTLFVVATVLYDASGTGSSYSTVTRYFSTDGCVTSDGLISFEPIISGDISLSEAISIDGSVSMSFGDISLNNLNGELDVHLVNNSYIWSNAAIQIYLGDPSWSIASTDFALNTTKFRLVFNGVCEDIDSKSRTVLSIKLRDKMERLNSPVTEAKLGNYGTWANSAQNADTIKPLIFGEVFNMTPLLMDPNNQGGQYMVSNGPVNQIIEIRDNGIPIYQNGSTAYTGATVDTSTGTFVLQYPPSGAITASVKGVNNSINLTTGALVAGTYVNNIANLIALIVTQYGKANSRLAAADLDLVNLAASATVCPQPVGAVITDTTNVLTLCQSLAASVGGQMIFTREGLLQLQRFGVGATPGQDPLITVGATTSAPVSTNDMVFDSFSISSKYPFSGAFKLGYCRNWTPQPGLLTSIPADHKDLYANEWLTVTATAAGSLISNYKLDTDPPQIDTALLTTSDATTEAQRRVTYNNAQRFVYKFTGIPKLLALRLGQLVYLCHDRFNLYNSGLGRPGQVISLSPNWTSTLVDVEVII